MSYPTRTPQISLGGIQRFEYRRLRDAMMAGGLDIDAAGADWLLHMSDIHFYWANGSPPTTFETIAAAIKAELLALAATPPQYIVVNGDILTEYAPTVGYGPWPAGTYETGYANIEMPYLAALAPLKVTTGNHDSAPYEDPIDDYLTTNCPWYVGNGGLQSWVCGGARILSISVAHDTAIPPADIATMTATLEVMTDPDQDLVLFYHAPSLQARVTENQFKIGLLSAVPVDFPNRIWAICGHVHETTNAVYSIGATTIAQQSFGCASEFSFSADSTKPCMSAVGIKNGKVQCLLIWNGKTGMWTVMPPIARTAPAAIPMRDDGVTGTVLAEYWESEFDRTGIHLSTPNTGGTFRDAMSWLAEVGTVIMKFPLPPTATHLWISINALPTTIQMSGDGSSYQTVTPSALDRSITHLSIPVPLRGGAFLWVSVAGGSRSISGWGFSNIS